MDNPFTNRLWKTSGNSPGFNLGYYTSDKEGAAGSQVWDKFKDFKANRKENMHWADYVRANPGLEAHYQANLNSNTDEDGNPLPATLSRWEWGQQHYENAGQYEGPNNTTTPGIKQRFTPQIIADPMGGHRRYMETIMTRRNSDTANTISGLSPTNQKAFETFARQHFETQGKSQGLFGSESGWYNSPGQQQVRADAAAAIRQANADKDRQLQIDLAAEAATARQANADAAQASMQKAAEGAEYGRLASRRGGGSGTLSASGAATFKGKGLRTSANKRGKGRGTAQLRRPYERSSLSIASMAKGNNPSTLNL